MFDKLKNSCCNKLDKFIDNPVGSSIEIVTQPIRDGIEIVEGIKEGELREKACVRLGVDVLSGTCASELLEWY